MSALSACVQKALKPSRFRKQRAHHLLCALEARTVSALSACVCAIFCDCEGAMNTFVGLLMQCFKFDIVAPTYASIEKGLRLFRVAVTCVNGAYPFCAMFRHFNNVDSYCTVLGAATEVSLLGE